MARQGQLLGAALRAVGVPTVLRTVMGASHERMVLQASRADEGVGPAVLQFVATTPCPRARFDTAR